MIVFWIILVKEIKKARKYQVKDNTYTTLQFDKFKSENYDYMSLSYKTTDATYIVVGTLGNILKIILMIVRKPGHIYKDFLKNYFLIHNFIKLEKKLSNTIDSNKAVLYAAK